MKHLQKKAFTLVETMVVAFCLAVLLGPIFVILRSGSKTSLAGMLKIETTLESRRVIRQVHQDLKLAIIPLSHIWTSGAIAFPAFTDILTEEGSAPLNKYSFYAYPTHQSLYKGTSDDIIYNRSSKTGYNPRNIAKITYSLEKEAPTSPFLSLKRTEEYNGKKREQILSKRINYFRIKPIEMTPPGTKNQYFFFVTLQIIDSLERDKIKDKIAAADLGVNKASGDNNGIVLADFFDMVYPEYFHAFWNHPQTNPSWHTFPVNLPD